MLEKGNVHLLLETSNNWMCYTEHHKRSLVSNLHISLLQIIHISIYLFFYLAEIYLHHWFIESIFSKMRIILHFLFMHYLLFCILLLNFHSSWTIENTNHIRVGLVDVERVILMMPYIFYFVRSYAQLCKVHLLNESMCSARWGDTKC